MKRIISKLSGMINDFLGKASVYITTRPVALQPVVVRQQQRKTRRG